MRCVLCFARLNGRDAQMAQSRERGLRERRSMAVRGMEGGEGPAIMDRDGSCVKGGRTSWSFLRTRVIREFGEAGPGIRESCRNEGLSWEKPTHAPSSSHGS